MTVSAGAEGVCKAIKGRDGEERRSRERQNSSIRTRTHELAMDIATNCDRTLDRFYIPFIHKNLPCLREKAYSDVFLQKEKPRAAGEAYTGLNTDARTLSQSFLTSASDNGLH